jgi:protein phosphatase
VTLAVVADGVSSGRHSEVAAQMTVEAVRAGFEAFVGSSDLGSDAVEAVLRAAAIEAQRQVLTIPFDDPQTASATTLVAVCVIGGRATGIWCGDSRAYGVTVDDCKALTRDHSWVNLVVDRGLLSLEDAMRDPRAHVITRWLGQSDPPREDPGLETFRLDFLPGECLLVCSDGLFMYFQPPDHSTRELASLAYSAGTDVQEAVRRMVQTALERGGYDNITAALVMFE